MSESVDLGLFDEMGMLLKQDLAAVFRRGTLTAPKGSCAAEELRLLARRGVLSVEQDRGSWISFELTNAGRQLAELCAVWEALRCGEDEQ